MPAVRPIALVIAAFAALCAVYAWATPPFEASDELWHMGMVQQLAETRALPVQVPGVTTIYEQEGSQPPLYYALGALLVSPIDRSDFAEATQPNPHARAGIPGAVGNKNLVLHDARTGGAETAVYVLRAFSIVLACGSVYAVYRAAREIAPEIALLAAGLTAFNPMFLFISASVNNDNLVTFLNSVILWQVLVLLRNGYTTRRMVLLAILVALASLSKLSGLLMAPLVASAGLWLAVRHGRWRELFAFGAWVAGAWALLAGWWCLRNIQLYGELFGTRMMAEVAGVRSVPLTLAGLLGEFEGFRIAYWGWFGAVNVLTTPVFYAVMDALTLAALAGLTLYLLRDRPQAETRFRLALLAGVIVLAAASVIAWTAQTYASQGRLLFPVVAATSTLLALGLRTLTLRAWALAPALAIFALAVPVYSIVPQYGPPAPLAALPARAWPVYARFDDVTLVGYSAENTRYAPGEGLLIYVYWQVDAPSERDLSLYLHAVSPAGDVIGRVDSYPGGGTLRTSTWLPGLYADRYVIPLEPDAAGAFSLRVQVGWWDYASGALVEAVDAQGAALDAVMLDTGGFADGQPQTLSDATPLEAEFGGLIRLTGYAWQGDALLLAWEASADLTDDYVVFAQALDNADQIVAQGDAPPTLPTRFWRPGERYVTRHPLASAAGVQRVIAGWYLPLTGQRLPTASGDFIALPAP